MSFELPAGVMPVTAGASVASAPTAVAPTVTLPENFNQPINQDVYADPNEPVVLDPQVAPVQPVEPVAPVTPVAPVVPEVAPTAAPKTVFSKDWKISDAIEGGNIILQEANRICASKQLDLNDVIVSMRDGTFDMEDQQAMTEALGDSASFVISGVKNLLDQHFKLEAAEIHKAVGGQEAWNILSQWAGSADIKMEEKQQLNAMLARGGFEAKMATTLLMNAFNAHAPQEVKNKMSSISILNAAPAAAPAPAAPTQAAPQLGAAPVVPPAALLQGTTAAPVAGQFEPIRNARELATLSQKAIADGTYDARFEDQLAQRLKQSMQAGVYKRTSLPTPPPANIMAALRART